MLLPKISAIVCFFNMETFLEETISSVLSQTFTDWELILVDDGSTDNSGKIATIFCQKHPNQIFYFKHPFGENKGLSFSRNTGLKYAKGKYICFLDADDIWLPSFFSQQVQKIEDTKASMVISATLYWYSWKTNIKLTDKIINIGVSPNTYNPPDLFHSLYPIGNGIAPSMCSLIVEKDAVKRLGGFNKEFKGMYEDQVFLTKFYLNEIIYVSDDCQNYYRQRADSMMHQSNDPKNYYFYRLKFLKWLEGYAKEYDISIREKVKNVKKKTNKESAIYLRAARFNKFKQWIRSLISRPKSLPL